MLTTGATPGGDHAGTIFVTAAVLLVVLLEHAQLRASWARPAHALRHAVGIHTLAAAAALVVGTLTHLHVAAEAACGEPGCLLASRCALLAAFVAYEAVLAASVVLDDR